MKVSHCILIITFWGLLSSCILEKLELEQEKKETHYYYKNFFLGETTFTIGGEAPGNLSPLITRISTGSNTPWSMDNYDQYNKDWEISATEISVNQSVYQFKILVDITANGVTLGLDTLSEDVLRPTRFSDDFPACKLRFYEKDTRDKYQRIFTHSKIGEVKYDCEFIYVAEPVDLSGTDMIVWEQIPRYVHFDYNFTKPGWYKVIGYGSPIGNDPSHSSAENIYFEEQDKRYES